MFIICYIIFLIISFNIIKDYYINYNIIDTIDCKIKVRDLIILIVPVGNFMFYMYFMYKLFIK